jgi:hypothetical protein
VATAKKLAKTIASVKLRQQEQSEGAREEKRAHQNNITSSSQGGIKDNDNAAMKQSNEGHSKVGSAIVKKSICERETGCCHALLEWMNSLFARCSPSRNNMS